MTRSASSLRQQCHALRGQLKLMSLKATRRDSDTIAFLTNRYEDLQRSLTAPCLSRDAPPASVDCDLRKSVELVAEMIGSIVSDATLGVDIPPEFYEPLPSAGNSGLWEPLLDDLEVAVAEYERSIHRQHRARLFEILDLLDAIARINGLDSQSCGGDSGKPSSCLHCKERLTSDLSERLKRFLRGSGVESIEVQAGGCAPIAETKIVARDGNDLSSEVVVTRVVEDGYRWKGLVLRKASVVVAERKE